MNILVIGANGKAGKLIVREAIKRGHQVTEGVRRKETAQTERVLEKDVLSITKDDIMNVDVVVNALGAWTPQSLPIHEQSARHLGQLLEQTNKRLIVVGGAGSLFVDAAHTMQLSQTPEFPKEYLPVATAMAKGLDKLRTFTQTDWTYVSPAADFDAEGAFTGEYLVGGETMIVNESGNSYISYTDYAYYIVDEIENTAYQPRQRVNVIAK